VKKENVKINKNVRKKKEFILGPFLSLGGGLVKEKKKDIIIKEKGEPQLHGSFRFTNGG
jgi:hypothetical protein